MSSFKMDIILVFKKKLYEHLHFIPNRIEMLLVTTFTFVLLYFNVTGNEYDLIEINSYLTLNVSNDYTMTVHYESGDANNTVLDNFFASPFPKVLYNYRHYNHDNADDDEQFLWINANKFINVIYMKDPQIIAKLTCNLRYLDVIIILVDDYVDIDDDRIIEIDGLSNSGSLIIINLNDNFAYTVKYFNGNRSKTLQKIDENVINLNDHFNNFKDFNGHELKIGFLYNYPFAFCRYINLTIRHVSTLVFLFKKKIN